MNEKSVPMVIFGEKSMKKNNIIYLTNKDFQSVLVDYRSSSIAISEIQRIQNSNLNGNPLLQFFSYDNFSTWWFFYNQIFDKFHKTISFVENFTKFLEKTKPKLIKINNNFENFDIIKQICVKEKIILKYSKLNYQKYQINNKTKLFSRKKGSSIITERKIKNRLKLFHENKKSLPNLNGKIVFALPSTYRIEIMSPENGKAERGEYLVSGIKSLLDNKENVIFIDLFSNVLQNDEVLQERIESEIETLPVEILFSQSNNQKRHKTFFEKFDQIINNKKFQNLFIYKDIHLWKQIEPIFKKMKSSPYLPYYLTLFDSLIEAFSNSKPKAIFLPYETGPLALAFILAGYRTKTLCIGMQHGIISDYESSYSHQKFASKQFPLGFPLPDYLLLFGELNKQMLIKKNYPSEKLVSFGNSMFFNLNKIKKFLSEKPLFEKYKISREKKIILFIPPALIEHYEAGTKYNYNTQVLKKLIESFGNNSDFIVLLKPHPRDNVKFYEKILKESKCTNVKIIFGNLLELLYISSVVVSTFSNAIIDAMCLKKPVVQVNFENLELHMPYDDFNAVFSTSLQNISSGIQNVIDNSKRRSELIKNGEDFIKKCYNIPEDNPISILQKIVG